MAPPTPADSSHDLHHEIHALRGRIDSVEEDVDRRFDKVHEKIDQESRSAGTRHQELMRAMSQLTTRAELSDQRAGLNHERVLSNIQESSKRIETLEAAKVANLQKEVDARAESGRHWVRYVVGTAAGLFMLGVAALAGRALLPPMTAMPTETRR